MGKIMYSAEEVNQILFDITLEKAKVEEKLEKIEQIVNQWNDRKDADAWAYREIKKVLEKE